MISQKYIKELGFKTIEDFFNYVINSEINGNYEQVAELLKKLSQKQFILFCNWFKQDYSQKPLNWFISKRVK